MKIAYRDNDQKGPGYGELVFSEAMFPDGPWKIAIQRASDHACLAGNDQWVGEMHFMALNGAIDSDGELVLSLGPAQVNSLKQMDQYRVTLKGADDNPLRGSLHVEKITYKLDGISVPQREDELVPAEETPGGEKAPEKPESGPEAAPEAKMAEGGAEALDSLNMPAGPEAPKNKTLKWLVPALVVFAILAGVIIYFAAFANKPKDAAPEPVKKEEPANPSAGSTPEKGENPPQKAKNSSAQPAPIPVETQVNNFFAPNNGTAEAAMTLGKNLVIKTDVDKDALYRLYYFAAQKDNPEGLLKYGECIDPSRPKWGSIRPDGAEAWRVYEKAKAAGVQDAAAAQAGLEAWLKAHASEPDAAKWLREIKQP